jgi:capsular polysaccharide transport system ATP-binding protein
MIEFRDVSKSFWTGTQRKVILDRASFRVEPGNSLGILAGNGTGKTTIINMMAGLEKPDEGTIRKTSRVSFPLGFMGGVNNKHSAKENCRYIARLYGLDPDYVESFCRWVCGLGEYFDMPLAPIPRGCGAVFLCADPVDRIRHLPDRRRHAGHRRCRVQPQGRQHPARTAAQESTVVIVSHSPKTLERFCRSAAVLRNGKLYQFETLEEAKRLYDYDA